MSLDEMIETIIKAGYESGETNAWNEGLGPLALPFFGVFSWQPAAESPVGLSRPVEDVVEGIDISFFNWSIISMASIVVSRNDMELSNLSRAYQFLL